MSYVPLGILDIGTEKTPAVGRGFRVLLSGFAIKILAATVTESRFCEPLNRIKILPGIFAYPSVGMVVSTPVRIPVGHRAVMVLRRV